MAAYFNWNNNEISKELLVSKFNIVLGNQNRLNDKKIPLLNEPPRSRGFVQNQPPEVFCKQGVFKKFANFTRKHPCWNLFSIKLRVFWFPVKFAKFLRTSIANNIYEKLLLFVSPQDTIVNSSCEFGLYKTLSEC